METITTKTFEILNTIECLSLDDFKKGLIENGMSENLARHITDKFAGYNNSVIKLFANLDLSNRRIFLRFANNLNHKYIE